MLNQAVLPSFVDLESPDAQAGARSTETDYGSEDSKPAKPGSNAFFNTELWAEMRRSSARSPNSVICLILNLRKAEEGGRQLYSHAALDQLRELQMADG